MADTLTANYDLVKPEINGSPDTWGNKLNANLDVVDANLKRVDDLATDAILRAGSGTDPDFYIRSFLRYADDVTLSNDFDLAHVALIKAWVLNASPIGIIVAWGGTVASIPLGWSLCDGGTYNGKLTPNLVDKFILGAKTTPAPGATGGTKTHGHSGATGGTYLSVSQMPSHTHIVMDPGHTHFVVDPGHSHVQYIPQYQEAFAGSSVGAANTLFTTTSTLPSVTGIFLGMASTGIAVVHEGGGQFHTHTIASADHMPPYYALAYLMRTKYPWE